MTRRKQKKAAGRISWDDDPEFQRWIRFLFDRDDPKGEWRFSEATMPLSEAQTVHYIHRLCATAETELSPIPRFKSPMDFFSSSIAISTTAMHCVTAKLISK